MRWSWVGVLSVLGAMAFGAMSCGDATSKSSSDEVSLDPGWIAPDNGLGEGEVANHSRNNATSPPGEPVAPPPGNPDDPTPGDPVEPTPVEPGEPTEPEPPPGVEGPTEEMQKQCVDFVEVACARLKECEAEDGYLDCLRELTGELCGPRGDWYCPPRRDYEFDEAQECIEVTKEAECQDLPTGLDEVCPERCD